MITTIFRVCLCLAALQRVLARTDEEGVVQQDRDGKAKDPGLTHYISRPDIHAPKWKLDMYHPIHNSPGFWFLAPYRGIAGEQSDKPWVGPAIYDGSNGELVWSGGLMFDTNIECFQVSTVNGTQLMTLVSHVEATTLNNDYTIRDTIDLEPLGFLNTHELNFVDNGTRVLFLHNIFKGASREESAKVGYDGECAAQWEGFIENDVTSEGWPQVFEWRSYGKISLTESTFLDGTLDHRCRGWDLLHANSVDKTPEGDYLFSARHTDTIYKISGTDGSIVWRLGGRQSDFKMSEEMVFSRQHHVRYRGQNETHIWLSMLDNAKGQDKQPASHEYSRGLLFAIDERKMIATLEKHYDHPYRGKGEANAIRRGNYQLLPNGNVFMGWSERAFQSEYTSDGQLVWEAMLQVDWMGSYRNYKFDKFVGKPLDPPDVVSTAHKDDRHGTVTVVHVSWNGATEVTKWVLHHTSPDGASVRVQVDSASKVGFETALRCQGYAKHVVVNAIDKTGQILGQSRVITTVADKTVPAEEIVKADRWLSEMEAPRTHPGKNLSKSVAFIVGALCGSGLLLLFLSIRYSGLGGFRRFFCRTQKYRPIRQEESDEAELPLHAVHRRSVHQEVDASDDTRAHGEVLQGGG